MIRTLAAFFMVFCSLAAAFFLYGIVYEFLDKGVGIHWDFLNNVIAGWVAGWGVSRAIIFVAEEFRNEIKIIVSEYHIALGLFFALVTVALHGLGVSSWQYKSYFNISTIVAVFVIICGAASSEMWALSSNVKSTDSRRFAASLFVGAIIAGSIMIAPALLLDRLIFLKDQLSVSAVAAWTSGMISFLIRILFKSDDIESEAAKSMIEGIVTVDLPVLIAAVLAYIIFRATNLDPIFWAVISGIISSLFGAVFGMLRPWSSD